MHKYLFIIMTLFNSPVLSAADWQAVYQARTGAEKHDLISRLAAEGDAKAQLILSHHFRLGEFVEKDRTQANKWLQESAVNGNADAAYLLATGYNSQKYDFPLDHGKAVMWLENAAKHGHKQAQYELGEHYHRGLGVKKNLILSYVWLTLASRDNEFTSLRSRHMVEDELTAGQKLQAAQLVDEYLQKYAVPYNN